jgi:hypothetical protein
VATDVPGVGDIADRIGEYGLQLGTWIVYRWRIGPHGLLQLKDGWHLLVIDFDQGERFIRNVLVRGCHGSDRVSDKSDILFRHNRLVAKDPPVGTLESGFKVCPCQNCNDTRQALGPRCIDPENACVRVRAPQNAPHQHAGEFKVEDVTDLARYTVICIDHRYTLANG